MKPATPSPTTFLLPDNHTIELLNPSPADIHLRHIAVALANTSALPGPLSEATRCLTAARLALPYNTSTALAALLSAAPSVYAGRIPAPFSDYLTTAVPEFRTAWRKLNYGILLAITEHMASPVPSPDNIRDANRLVLQAETLLARQTPRTPQHSPDAWLRFLEQMPPNRSASTSATTLPPVSLPRWPTPRPPSSYTSPIRLAHAISVALAHTPRYHALHGHYSVAQHSIAVASLLPPRMRLHALLHDAHEAWSGDLATPAQIAIDALSPGFRTAFTHARELTDHQLRSALNIDPLTPDDRDAIHRADREVLRLELQIFTAPATAHRHTPSTSPRDHDPQPFPNHTPGRNAWPQPIAASRFHHALLSSLATS